MIHYFYKFLMYELKAFPNAYFDVARNISDGIETESSIMDALAVTFGFFIMFGGIAFFIGAAIIILPLIITFVTVTIASQYVQESIFPDHRHVVDIIAIPILIVLVYYFGHTYLNFIFVPAFKFSLQIVLSILSIPSRYSS